MQVKSEVENDNYLTSNPVSQLPQASHAYSSVSASPDQQRLVIGGKDILRFVSLSPSGLSEICSIRMSQYFQATQSFGVSDHGPELDSLTPQNTSSHIHVATDINKVAWSSLQRNHQSRKIGGGKEGVMMSLDKLSPTDRNPKFDTSAGGDYASSEKYRGLGDNLKNDALNSLVAVGGSNGVVVIWHANTLLSGAAAAESKETPISNRSMFHNQHQFRNAQKSSDMTSVFQPEAIILKHKGAVNGISWHPSSPELLLIGSQDSFVTLWERRALSLSSNTVKPNTHVSRGRYGIRSWFGGFPSTTSNKESATQSFSWYGMKKFRTFSGGGAIRDIKWSPFLENVFAVVTESSKLVLYDIRLSDETPMFSIDASFKPILSLDWHPTRKYIVATGGKDCLVKVWDLENGLSFRKSLESAKLNFHSNTSDSDISSTAEIDDFNLQLPRRLSQSGQHVPSFGPKFANGLFSHGLKQSPFLSPSHRASKVVSPAPKTIYIIAMALPVTKVMWRPPAGCKKFECTAERNDVIDHHDAMFGVVTAGEGLGGGSNCLSLCSFHRPHMPLSVLEGSIEGPVLDFLWIDTPEKEKTNNQAKFEHRFEKEKQISDSQILSGTWQHALTVGKDGECLLQSFARGERPIFHTPTSAFALANLSPFQQGHGSLQIVSVHQRPPSGHSNDFSLCRLKCNGTSSQAPGVFKERTPTNTAYVNSRFPWKPKIGGQRQPGVMKLNFATIDKLDSDLLPQENCNEVNIAPELVHLSRFSKLYVLRPNEKFTNKVSICQHNAHVAKSLYSDSLFRMWEMLAKILEGCSSDKVLVESSLGMNAMDFLLLPTVRALLYKRADAGDVQTCVAICEVMEVIPPISKTSARQSGRQIVPKPIIPGLQIELVREWYFSYIEILQQICMFSHATDLIRTCHDPEISRLNQQSTTIHESCPKCWKPLKGVTTITEIDRTGQNKTIVTTQKACKSCRQRVGLCFLCHEPVTGIFVWCPGCGHGGHLDHALEWFSGKNPLQELCPTGCGHKCNFVQKTVSRSFPRTDSLAIFEQR